ncbi:ion transporter [Roseofilum reptotaenium CS-1145]|uniref:ion transporter n=1 Tax=Roseofilum reptotaenium TaxID=1233427 RepID=UPI000B093F47|nr:ion transporter [Roseofilum reptotaenium]MDB9515685.1 ion transporter [Roseofilum reptotaenium CS-1145]
MTSQLISPRQTLNQWLGIETLLGKIFNLTIITLVLISAAIFVIQTYNLPPDLDRVLDLANTWILLLFILEYLLRFWCAEQKLEYFLSIYSLIDLLIFIPFIFGVFDIEIGFSKTLIWFRILHLLRYLGAKTFLGIINSENNLIVTRICFTLFSIIFVYSGLIYQIEHVINPQSFRHFFDALYFCIVTMTTVGFGDITPLSEAGRWITLAMILTGISLIPWQVGDLVKHFVKESQKVRVECQDCGLLFHDPDARFCKHCGSSLVEEREYSNTIRQE